MTFTPRRRLALTAGLFGLVLIVSLLTAASTPASAVNNSTPIYNNTSNTTGIDSWTSGKRNATLVNVTAYISRLATFVIGSGTGQGGVGALGALLTGGVAFGATVALSRGRSGFVGGSVLAVTLVAGLVAVGMAPEWLYAVVLFALGAVGVFVMRQLLGP